MAGGICLSKVVRRISPAYCFVVGYGKVSGGVVE